MKRFYSIKYKIFFAIFGLSLFSLSLIWVVINETYAKSLCSNEENYNILATDKLKSEFDSTIENSQHTAAFLSSRNEIGIFLKKDPKAAPSYLDDFSGMYKFLQYICDTEPYVESVEIFGKNGQVCSTDTLLNMDDTIDYYKQQIGGNGHDSPRWTEKHTLAQKSTKNVVEVISYIYPVTGDSQGQEAYIVIDISYEYIEKEFIDFAIEANEKAFICNSEGKIILNYPNTTSFEPVVKEYPEILEKRDFVLNKKVFGVDNIIISNQLDKIQWKIIRVIPTDSITVQTQKMSFYLKILLLLSIIASFAIAMLLAQTITKPIHALSDACKCVKTGNLSYHLDVHGNDELGQLGHTFNLMIDQLNLYLKKELENQKQKTDLQFQILQAQINPHFLYNTLDSIKWLATMHNMNNIAEMSTALINLLKYNLSNRQNSTTLKDEIESVKNYITIEKFRYLDTFEFTTFVEQDTLNCQVLRFMLQPLVENSIIHGFRDVEQNYRIQIASYISDGALHVKVIDNGCGMDQERVRQINSGVKNDKCYSNIGVNNIKERIQLYFGTKYELTYSSLPDTGTIAEITLPVKHVSKERE